MLVPIRCFTCGGVIGDKYYKFAKRIKAGDDPKEILDSLGLKRYCCRRMVLANVDIIDQILPYYESIARRRIEFASNQTGT